MVSVMLAFYAAAPNPAAVTIGAALLGAGCSSMFICASAIVQRDAPVGAVDSVVAMMQACTGVSYGIGLLLMGFIGDAFNLHVAFGVGAIGLPLGFWAITVRSRHWRQAFNGSDPMPIERRPALAA